jgi:hypothetical protein
MNLRDAARGEVRRAGHKARSSASTKRGAWRSMPFGWDEEASWRGRSIARYFQYLAALASSQHTSSTHRDLIGSGFGPWVDMSSGRAYLAPRKMMRVR